MPYNSRELGGSVYVGGVRMRFLEKVFNLGLQKWADFSKAE